MAEKRDAELDQAKAVCQMLKRAGVLARAPVQGPFCKWARPPWPVAVPAQPPKQRPAIFTPAQPPYPIGSMPTSLKPRPPAQLPAPPAEGPGS